MPMVADRMEEIMIQKFEQMTVLSELIICFRGLDMIGFCLFFLLPLIGLLITFAILYDLILVSKIEGLKKAFCYFYG